VVFLTYLERSPMGITYLEGTVIGPSGALASVNFLVDSGATYTVLPVEVWRAIGLAPRRSIELRLADGTANERKVSECQIRLPLGEGHTPVILGEQNDKAVLGVVTLDVLGFVLNPLSRELQPMDMMLA
jgi:predicted aspartyl protease